MVLRYYDTKKIDKWQLFGGKIVCILVKICNLMEKKLEIVTVTQRTEAATVAFKTLGK